MTDGYHWLSRSSDTRHVTLIKPEGSLVKAPPSRFHGQRPFGFDAEGKLEIAGEEPAQLGDETPVDGAS